MRWQEEYKKKLVSAAEAAKAVKSGNLVVIPYRTNTKVNSQAIADRKNELHDVRYFIRQSSIDPAIFEARKNRSTLLSRKKSIRTSPTLYPPFSASALKLWMKNEKARIKRLMLP